MLIKATDKNAFHQTEHFPLLAALALVLALLTGTGTCLIVSHFGEMPLVWRYVLYAMVFAFIEHLLQLVAANADKSIMVTFHEIRFSTHEGNRLTAYFLFINMVVGIATTYLCFQTKRPEFLAITAASVGLIISYAMYCRERQFQCVKPLAAIVDVSVIRYCSLPRVRVIWRDQEKLLPFCRRPERLVSEIRIRMERARRLN